MYYRSLHHAEAIPQARAAMGHTCGQLYSGHSYSFLIVVASTVGNIDSIIKEKTENYYYFFVCLRIKSSNSVFTTVTSKLARAR